MLNPPPIEFSPLFVGQFERTLTLRIREAFPKGDGVFRPLPGRKFQELRKWVGCQGQIVSCVKVTRNIRRFAAARSLGFSCVFSRSVFSGLVREMSRATQQHERKDRQERRLHFDVRPPIVLGIRSFRNLFPFRIWWPAAPLDPERASVGRLDQVLSGPHVLFPLR